MFFPLCYILLDNGVGVVLIGTKEGAIDRVLKELKVATPNFDYDVRLSEDGQHSIILSIATRSTKIILELSEKVFSYLIEKQNFILCFKKHESDVAEKYFPLQLDRDLLIRIDALVKYAQKHKIELSKKDINKTLSK